MRVSGKLETIRRKLAPLRLKLCGKEGPTGGGGTPMGIEEGQETVAGRLLVYRLSKIPSPPGDFTGSKWRRKGYTEGRRKALGLLGTRKRRGKFSRT
jgi:hypothetical protein